MIKAIEQLRNWEHSIHLRNKSLKRQNEALFKLRKIETETKISNLKVRKEQLWKNTEEFLKQFNQETKTLHNKKYSMIFTYNPSTKFQIIKNIPLKDQLDTTIENLSNYKDVSDLMNEHFPTNNLYELLENYNLYFKGNPVNLELSYNEIVGEPKNNEHMDYAWFSLIRKPKSLDEETLIEIPQLRQRNLTIKSPKVTEEEEYSSDETPSNNDGLDSEDQEEKDEGDICPIISTFIIMFMLVNLFIWINFKVVVSI